MWWHNLISEPYPWRAGLVCGLSAGIVSFVWCTIHLSNRERNLERRLAQHVRYRYRWGDLREALKGPLACTCRALVKPHSKDCPATLRAPVLAAVWGWLKLPPPDDQLGDIEPSDDIPG